MCLHNSMSKRVGELAARYGRKTDIVETWEEIIREKNTNGQNVNNMTESVYHISAFTEPDCSIVTDSDEIQVMQWGLLPSIVTDVKEIEKFNKQNWFKNARAEGIFTTFPYKFVIQSQRCIIPSTGYMEYHHNQDGTTTPFFIYLPDEEIFSFAGVWDIWEHPQTKERISSFTMITTKANPMTAAIHNGGRNPGRMPVILKKDDEEKWLDTKLSKKHIEELMKAYDENEMDAYPIHNDFVKKNPYDRSILEKA